MSIDHKNQTRLASHPSTWLQVSVWQCDQQSLFFPNGLFLSPCVCINIVQFNPRMDVTQAMITLADLPLDIWTMMAHFLTPADWRALIQVRHRALRHKLKRLQLDIRLDNYALQDMKTMSWFHHARSWRAYHLPMSLASMRHLRVIDIRVNAPRWNFEQLHGIPYHCRQLQQLTIRSCPITIPDAWYAALPPSLTHLSIAQIRIPDECPSKLPDTITSLKLNVLWLIHEPVLPKRLKRLRMNVVLTCPLVYRQLQQTYEDVVIRTAWRDLVSEPSRDDMMDMHRDPQPYDIDLCE